jgi:hypothetical protein
MMRASGRRLEPAGSFETVSERTPPERTDMEALSLDIRAYWAGRVAGCLTGPS